MKRKAIVLDMNDNVASALVDLKAGEQIKVHIPGGDIKEVTLIQAIRLGHKLALENIDRGEDVRPRQSVKVRMFIPIMSAMSTMIQLSNR